jgi:uncharacterized RDD family membrane protein YckC
MKPAVTLTPDRYVQEVMANIHAPQAERAQIETDLHTHIQEALHAGSAAEDIQVRMGSPREVAAEFMAQVELVHAGFGRRLLAFGIDLTIIILLCGALAIVAILLSNLITPSNPTPPQILAGAILITGVISCLIGIVGIILTYFPLLEGRFGYTPGKRLLGLRVLGEDQLPVGYKESVLRRLSFYFNILPVDALFIFFTAKKQRAFDIVARTIVVRL